MDLRGKTILLTGASSGIGLALSRLLAQEKVKLALLARRENILRRLAVELKSSGSVILPLQCDVSKKEDIRKSYLEVKSQFGQVDIAILNSGFSHRAGVEHFEVDVARDIFDVNVFGMLYFIEELLPDFKCRKEGIIVGVSSLSDCRGFPRSGFYNASKAATTFLLESLRIELKKFNIKVITVKPGFVKTEMTERNQYHMPFLMPADKAAGIIIKGIKKEKRLIQFPLPMVLGTKLLKAMPDFMFEMIAGRIKK
ncbi:MAG: SDR family NAD(P)-dependent oxidoreductase [Candidatus Aminicenantes bacterium]|nr:SDR family NAD(P)-dependent oxidoreductase [Candidatus Aminicenantes bacterium]